MAARNMLVLYFSLAGHTAFIANALAEATGAEKAEIRLQRPLPKGFAKFVIGGMQAVFKMQPRLQPIAPDPAAYDLIFLGGPVWAGRLVSPLRSLLATYRLHGKQIALFFCCADNANRPLADIKQLLAGNTVIGEITFKEPVMQEAQAARAKTWAQSLLTVGA